MVLKIEDHRQEERYYENNGIRFLHIATLSLTDLDRKFVIIQTLHDNKIYIEEKITNKISDLLVGADKLIQIPEESLWLNLYRAAVKAGILK